VDEDALREEFEVVTWECDAIFDRIAAAMRAIYEGM
jgi:hypothetical protein